MIVFLSLAINVFYFSPTYDQYVNKNKEADLRLLVGLCTGRAIIVTPLYAPSQKYCLLETRF